MNCTLRALKYKAVEAWQADKLDAKVNRLLAEGWVLYGHPAIAACGDGKCAYVQAMVRV